MKNTALSCNPYSTPSLDVAERLSGKYRKSVKWMGWWSTQRQRKKEAAYHRKAAGICWKIESFFLMLHRLGSALEYVSLWFPVIFCYTRLQSLHINVYCFNSLWVIICVYCMSLSPGVFSPSSSTCVHVEMFIYLFIYCNFPWLSDIGIWHVGVWQMLPITG